MFKTPSSISCCDNDQVIVHMESLELKEIKMIYLGLVRDGEEIQLQISNRIHFLLHHPVRECFNNRNV